ncbi:hypothetical protein [Pseudomonas cerasi]
MKMVNYQKKIILIHDGLEDEFLKNEAKISCPCCDGMVYFGLYNSMDFNRYDEKKRKVLACSIKGLSSRDDGVNEFRFKNNPMRVSENKCSNGMHEVLVVFTYKEIQPARYQSYLVGVFDDQNLT